MKHIFNFKHMLIWFTAILLCAHMAYGQHYISIYLENGDHLKGRWLGGDEKSIQIEVYDQQLSIPLREIVYITAFDDSRTIPIEAAEKTLSQRSNLLAARNVREGKIKFYESD